MAHAAAKERWGRCSALMALIANVNRDPKKGRAFRPSDFDPYADRKSETIAVDKDNMDLLKQAFSRTTNGKDTQP